MTSWPPISPKTAKVWEKAEALILEEIKKGIIDVETHAVSGIDNFAPGYIDKDNEVIVGLQTDAPLKRIVNPFGGIRNATSALEQYGYHLDPEIERHFRLYRKTHNEGVFDAYPKRTRTPATPGLLTGLPDAYGRGRIVGDYRRVPLYGTDFLIEEKQKDLDMLDGPMTDERIRLREEVQMQIRALEEMASMAAKYGCDITRPAENAHEAVQNLYMAYLAGIKENNGAATSLGRVHLPGHLHPAGPGQRSAGRAGRPGAHRPVCHQAAPGASPAHPASTTSSSAATPPGSPSPSAAWAWTAAPW